MENNKEAHTELTIFVAGHYGMVGSAIIRELRKKQPNARILTCEKGVVDLCCQSQVNTYFAEHQITHVYLAAAKVGGIYANHHYPGEFIYQNLMIATNVIHASYKHGVKRLLNLGSSCIYPKLADQPIVESALLRGELEASNEPYAVAKIAAIKLCESYNRQYGMDYRSVMPTNLYGEQDNFHPQHSHVIPALLFRFHQAQQQQAESVSVWGSGEACREFLYVDDLAQACVFLMSLSKEQYQQGGAAQCSHINVGTGEDISIAQLAKLIAKVVNYQGDIFFDTKQLEGVKKKCLDVGRLTKMGWRAQTTLLSGLVKTYQWYLKNIV